MLQQTDPELLYWRMVLSILVLLSVRRSTDIFALQQTIDAIKASTS